MTRSVTPTTLFDVGPPDPRPYPLPFYETDQQLDRFQRIEVISRVQGFLPASKPEQVEAMGLQAFLPQPDDHRPRVGGAAKHLAEVVKRQSGTKKDGTPVNIEDPMSTARKLARNYIDYTKDAKASGHDLADLEQTLSEVLNPELVMEQVSDPTQRGLLSFLRFFDLSLLRDDKGFNKIGYDPQLVDYTPENGGIVYYLGEALRSWRVHQVKRRLPEAREAESSRFSFWVARVVEVDKFYPKLRPITQEGLDQIYGRQPAAS